MSLPVCLQAIGLARRYPVRGKLLGRTQWLRAVEGIDFEIAEGEAVALVGESGCGKSTTARLITQLEPPDSGRILLDGRDATRARGRDLQHYRRQVQMVFQDPMESLNPRQTVLQVISRPILNFALASGGDVLRRVEELLELVGLSPASVYLGRYPHQLSGGQRQRVAIAAALAVNPRVLVADEPVASLDISIRAQILSLLRTLQSRLGLSLLFISHDLGVVRSFCTRTSIMYLGKIIESGPTDRIFRAPSHPYTRMLIAATPIADPRAARRRQRTAVRGEVPTALAPPSGCSFHPRCPIAEQRCSVLAPALRSIEAGRQVACHLGVVGKELPPSEHS
ncbi:MAG: ATP-binding cassette domain-containing protein [Hyphomicrobiales bacterium]|nr:ATP-binding cassette domain-containing protein [Hyphomicrobiales bacterium]